MLGLLNGLAVVHGVVAVLVVVRRAFLYRLRRNSAGLIGVDGRVLREVIVAIALSRLERGDRVARFLAGPLVGIEVHLARCVGVLLHIRLHGVIGILQQIERRRLHAGGVQHRDRRGVRNAHGILRQVDGEVTQRDQGRGHLHLHLVAHRNVVRTRDGDHDVLQIGSSQAGMHVTAKMVRVDVSVRGLGLAAVHRSVVHELGQVGDLHVIAQLIVKGDVAGLVLEAFACLRRIAGALRDLLGDVVEHMLQLIGVGRALVERGVFTVGALRAFAEAPFVFALLPPTRFLIRIRRRRIVARHGMHEVVLIVNALRIGILCRIGALEDADGVHRSTRIFHSLGRPNGARGDARIKCALGRWLAVSKEDDNLLYIGTTRGLTLRKLQACGGIRRASRLDGVHLRREGAFRIVGARSQLLHHLAVVVPIPVSAIPIVADLVGLVPSELHDSDLMLLGGILDRRILRSDLIDERVRCALERVNTLRFIAAAHGVIHRPGGIEHQHDVERRGRRSG